jgi:hypothetical protein
LKRFAPLTSRITRTNARAADAVHPPARMA